MGFNKREFKSWLLERTIKKIKERRSIKQRLHHAETRIQKQTQRKYIHKNVEIKKSARRDKRELVDELAEGAEIAAQQKDVKTLVFKCLHGLAPDYLTSKFSERNISYNLRDSENKLNVRLPRTNYFKNSFSYSCATLWNGLPYEARSAEFLKSFKSEISKAL